MQNKKVAVFRGGYRNFEKEGALRISNEGGPTMVGGYVPENFEN